FVRTAGAIDAVTCDRVERIGDGEDARVQIDLCAHETVRVARPIPTFMMLRDDARRAREKFDARQNLRAQRWMLAHALPLALVQRGRLAQDRVGNTDLADVVQERTKLKRAQVCVRHTNLMPKAQGETDDALGMSVRLAVARFKRGGERLQGRAVRVCERI